MLTKDFAVHLKDGTESENEKTFEGYASTFDREPDSYGDVVAKGAFADTLKAHEDGGRRIPLLFGHVMDDPDYNLGYVDAAEDEKGLHVTGHIFMDTPKGETVYNLLKRGQVYQMSFAYDTLDEATVTLDDGTKANELRKLDLFECSVVTVPANQNAIIEEVKSMDSKIGKRNSKADEDVLNNIRESAQSIIEAIDSLTADDHSDEDTEEPSDGGDGPDAQTEPDEGQNDDGKAFLAAYKQALINNL